jgi:hypothetical protein
MVDQAHGEGTTAVISFSAGAATAAQVDDQYSALQTVASNVTFASNAALNFESNTSNDLRNISTTVSRIIARIKWCTRNVKRRTRATPVKESLAQYYFKVVEADVNLIPSMLSTSQEARNLFSASYKYRNTTLHDYSVAQAYLNNPAEGVRLGYPPHRIDISTSIDGVDFESAWIRKTFVDFDGQAVIFIGRERLVHRE